MGVVKRQTFKGTLVSFLGVGVALWATVAVYPRALEAYGLSQTIFSVAMLLAPFATFGGASVALRYFTRFKEVRRGGEAVLLSLLLSVGVVGALLLPPLAWLFLETVRPWLPESFDTGFLRDNRYIIWTLTFVVALTQVTERFISNYRRIVVPALFSNLLPKLVLPLLIYLLFAGVLDLQRFLWWYVLLYSVVLVGQLVYLQLLTGILGRLHFAALPRRLVWSMMRFGAYNILAVLGSLIALRIDMIMVSGLEDAEAAGIFRVCVFAALVLDLPMRAVYGIAGPLIAGHWAKGEVTDIRDMYRRSSLVLAAAGAGLYAVIGVGILDVFELTGKADVLRTGYAAFLFMGLAKVVDLTFGLNGHIIGFSSKYAFSLVVLPVLAVSNIVLNYLFIETYGYGITGAALATLLALLLFNVIKYGFIRIKFGLSLQWGQLLSVIALIFCVYGLVDLLPRTTYPLLNIGYRCGSAALLVVGLLFASPLVPDVRDFLRDGAKRYLPFYG